MLARLLLRQAVSQRIRFNFYDDIYFLGNNLIFGTQKHPQSEANAKDTHTQNEG